MEQCKLAQPKLAILPLGCACMSKVKVPLPSPHQRWHKQPLKRSNRLHMVQNSMQPVRVGPQLQLAAGWTQPGKIRTRLKLACRYGAG